MSLREERRRILKMVEEGKITAEEGANLMEILEESSNREGGAAAAEGGESGGPEPTSRTGRMTGGDPVGGQADSTGFILGGGSGRQNTGAGSCLVIKIIDRATGDEEANIRVPLKLAWMLGSIIPKAERQKLADYGIDIDALLLGTENAEPGILFQVDNESEPERIIIVVE